MLDVHYLFRLKPGTVVDTEGGEVTASNIAGREYFETDHFQNEQTEAYVVHGQNGGFTVKKDCVKEIIDV